LSEIEIFEKRSFWSMIIGLIFIGMAIASLLTIRNIPGIPEVITFNLKYEVFDFNIHSLIHLLAKPSLYIASIWGDESMVTSLAFLFLGLGLSLIFRKKISSRLRKS